MFLFSDLVKSVQNGFDGGNVFVLKFFNVLINVSLALDDNRINVLRCLNDGIFHQRQQVLQRIDVDLLVNLLMAQHDREFAGFGTEFLGNVDKRIFIADENFYFFGDKADIFFGDIFGYG